MKVVMLGSFLLGGILLGCNQNAPDFTLDVCKDDDNTTVLDDFTFTGMKSNWDSWGDPVDPPEEGESFHGLTCIAFRKLPDDEVEVAVVNFWKRCIKLNGFIDSNGGNQYQITLREGEDVDTSKGPYDFSLELGIEPDLPTLTIEVLNGDSSINYGFEAVFQISEDDSGIQCWYSGY